MQILKHRADAVFVAIDSGTVEVPAARLIGTAHGIRHDVRFRMV